MSEQIKSPYNFVPLADFVYEPEWADRVSQDIPFSDGLSGVLECELTAHTPLHIGCGDEKNGMPVRRGDEFIVPGSSLKGMIRNVLGIAAFGRFDRIDDYRMSIRDLTPAARPIYGNRMVSTDEQGHTRPSVRAGWLHLIDGQWHLEPCKYARVEHSDLAGLRPDVGWQRGIGRCPAADKYKAWGKEAEAFLITANVTSETRPKGRVTLAFDRAVPTDGDGDIEGWLVLTGQPGPKKHLDFVFYGETGRPQPVARHVWRDFQMIHKDTPEWRYLTTESPYWRAYQTVPVFYLASRTEHGLVLEAIGLSQMFRLPFRHSIGDLRPDGLKHGGRDSETPLDMTDLLFGDAFEDTPRLKGRVQFGLGRAQGEVRPGSIKELVLSNPKPSFYPAYVHQDGKKQALTYSDDEAKLAGWKRYPAAGDLRNHPGNIENDKLASRARFLDAGTRFRFSVRFHNLRPAELGALYWSLTLGGNERLVHRLGKGKPYGYGEVSIRVLPDASRVVGVAGDSREVEAAFSDASSSFEETMDRACKGQKWRQTEQVRALLTMSDPTRSQADELTYYATPKDYQELKKRGPDGSSPRMKRYF
jgi:CRISPR-associated protein (TIGR03986 family)